MNKFLKYFKWGGIINTIYLNLKVFPLKKALRIPVIVGPKVCLKGLHRGCLECGDKTGIVNIGIKEGSFGMHHSIKSHIVFKGDGKLVFRGKALLQSNFHLNIAGTVTLGDKFSSNTGFVLSCGKSITFGDDCLLGWNVTVIDGDGHKIICNGNITNADKSIDIGNHCWIAANATVLKGVRIVDGTVVPYGSVITKSNTEANTIFNGRVLKGNVEWKH